MEDETLKKLDSINEEIDTLNRLSLSPTIMVGGTSSIILLCTIACCTRYVGHGHRYFKCIRWYYLVHQLALLLLDLSLHLADIIPVNQTYIYFLIVSIIFGVILGFLPTYIKRAPSLCCGTRLCCSCVRQTKFNLKELLQDIDRDIPTDRELSNLKQICLDKGIEKYRLALENWFLNAPIEILFTGSAVERFGLPILSDWVKKYFRKNISFKYALFTDFDLMFCFKDLRACNGSLQTEVHFEVISTDYVQPGYAALKLTEYGYNCFYDDGRPVSSILGLLTRFNDSNDLFFNAGSVKKIFYLIVSRTKLKNYPQGSRNCCCNLTAVKVKQQGPAINMKTGTFLMYDFCCPPIANDGFLADLTFGIKASWPSVSDWKERTGRFWPSPEEVDRIVEGGSHFVAKSQTDDNIGITWRYSFSKAEVELSKLVNPVARKCYLALKAILKDHLQPIAPWLKSYHLKTILYWTMEKTPAEFWEKETLENCFSHLIESVKNAISNQSCPHLWISTINLFDKELITERMYEHLLLKVNRIARNPHWYISSHKPVLRDSMDDRSEANNSDEEIYIIEGNKETETMV
uniref:Mab-21-like HhH/H2TH-like domain-containing protein n=1 Tax=Clytia hemisphaerica TaxID=252671 RepID=A0A7M5X3U4_9CNID